MKVKKYVAPTMPEAMNQIRKELGANAVILNSKEVNQGGFLGFFKKRKIEVVAAIDPQPHAPKTSNTSYNTTSEKPKALKGNASNDVLQEIKHLKKIIEQQSLQTRHHYQPDYKIVYQHLIDQEIESDLASELIENVIKQHEEKKIEPTLEQIFQDVKYQITDQLHFLSFEGIRYDKKIIHFVGPTGVGKTTTIAKIAAKSMLNENKKVAFITADTYRIAAIEQLKTYARILDVPIEVAYNLNDYKTAVEQFANYDLILVDTAGRNFREKKYVAELKRNIQFETDIETYLVLSLTAKPKDIQDIYDQFQHIPIKELIFTKIDETRQYGSMLNVMLTNKKGIAFLTNGQDVPDDLIQPSPELITSYIIGENHDS
ncbi:flagellar biosynthesis protein FlhF [Virgibacillus oceani]|uniref:Flagellar biosynthesis protein FlhF n=1 Tax=Virgibacillus oceani TaxID=1479511 RepID=A0A917M091_9BACI|nr:flagellar biosynthesis protein FlhF [Virgibacillus oceani]GGG68897.1 flagellar biosynthesis protein FlhF [Virgibacillus oceani]